MFASISISYLLSDFFVSTLNSVLRVVSDHRILLLKYYCYISCFIITRQCQQTAACYVVRKKGKGITVNTFYLLPNKSIHNPMDEIFIIPLRDTNVMRMRQIHTCIHVIYPYTGIFTHIREYIDTPMGGV